MGQVVEKIYKSKYTGQMMENAFDTFNNMADAYSNRSYSVGEYCIHDNTLYVCIVAISTGEPWTAAHWQKKTIADLLSSAVYVVSFDTTTGMLNLSARV